MFGGTLPVVQVGYCCSSFAAAGESLPEASVFPL